MKTASKKTESRKVETPVAVKASKKARKVAAPVVHGREEGTREERILAALSNGALTSGQIAEALGLPNTPNSRPNRALRALEAAKLIVRTEEGAYEVAKASKKAPRK